MRVQLAYGRTGLVVEVPDDAIVIEPTYVPGLPDETGALVNAMRHPLGASSLRRAVGSGQTVAISVCDVTRPMPSARVMPVVLKELSGIPDERIVILIATGTHRANTDAELREMLGDEIVDRYRVVNHNAFDAETNMHVGETTGGIPVSLDREWVESDFKITTGFVEPHFFAGFSGGPKMVAPGLAAFETTVELHGARLIGDPRSTWGVTKGNPIHDAIREIAAMTGVDFSVDVTINRDSRITSVYAGEMLQVHAAACDVSRRIAMQGVRERFDVVLTTNSGYPLDQNLYQCVKGMSAASQIVRDGGTIVCAGECSDGIPAHGEYGKLLASRDSPEALLEMIAAPGYAHRDQWQVQLQAQIQQRARVYVKSGLPADQIEAAHFIPADDVEQTVVESLKRHGPGSTLCILPEGPQTIPYVE